MDSTPASFDGALVPDGPQFGPLSRPYPKAVAAFRTSPDKMAPLVDPVHEYGLTDVGQATRFAEQFGAHFRYDHTRRAWLRWAGQIFRPDNDGAVTRAVVQLAESLYIDAAQVENLKARESIARFAIAQQSRRKVQDVLELAKSLPPIADSGTSWNTEPFLLATPWGVVDLQNGTCRDGQAADRLTYQTNAKYDPTAKCPRWIAFVNEVFDRRSDVVDYVQRAIGYSLTGDVREQVVFLLVGSGANGKSTLLETVGYLLGDYSYACPFATFEAHQGSSIGADVAALAGRRFVTSSETNSSSRFNEARIKALTGGDTMNARHLYGNPFEFRPVAKVWLSVNHKPAVADDSYGFWRRVHVIPFTRTFAGTADDKTLKTTLREEGSGILNWMIVGARSWLRDGLQPPAEVVNARDEYQRENDPLADFLDETCVTAPGTRAAAASLFAAYVRWCESSRPGRRDWLSRKAFGSAMTKRYESRHTEAGKVYIGVGIRQELTDVPSVQKLSIRAHV